MLEEQNETGAVIVKAAVPSKVVINITISVSMTISMSSFPVLPLKMPQVTAKRIPLSRGETGNRCQIKQSRFFSAASWL